MKSTPIAVIQFFPLGLRFRPPILLALIFINAPI
jgi:hypothetical protein